MKNIFFVFVSLVFFACNGGGGSKTVDINYPASNEKIHWLTIEEAQVLNKNAPREMIVDVYTEWCGPCKMMDRMTFSDPAIISKIHEKYYAVKFDAESATPIKFGEKDFANPNHNPSTPKNRRNSPHQFAQFLELRGYPSLVILNPDLSVKNKLVGFKQPDQLLPEL